MALDEEIKPALDLIERALRSTARFDPQSEERVFRIAMSDDAQVSFLPVISEQLLQVMPKCRLVDFSTDWRAEAAIFFLRSTLIISSSIVVANVNITGNAHCAIL